MECRQGGIGGNALDRKGRQRRAYQGHVACRPRETKSDANLHGSEKIRSTRSESIERARADERALKRETQIAGL